jgi:hypothetical protein
MKFMIRFSLILNIAVLVPICYGIASGANWAERGYGVFSSAQGILLSIYIAICIASIALLFIDDPRYVSSLLFVQVVYKITTPFTVGTLGNPVVISNLLIAVVHSVTLVLIYKALYSPEKTESA